MKVALFIPCYVDAFFPEVGIATLELLERLGCERRLPARPDLLRPADGQQRLPRRRARHRGAVRAELRRLRPHRHALGQLRPPRARPDDRDRADAGRCRRCAATPASWSSSCTTCWGCANSRGPSSRTRWACTSAARRCAGCARPRPREIDEPAFNKPARLLSAREGHRVRARRSGPTNAAASAAPSRSSRSRCRPRWARTRSTITSGAGAEYIVSPDMSCVMHQQGCAQRAGLPLKFIHIAQVLNGARA